MPSVIQALQATARDLGRGAIEFLYPATCVRCGDDLPAVAERNEASPAGERFCRGCYELLRCRIERACLTCGAPVGPHLDTWGCRHCRTDAFAFERVIALGTYERELQSCCRRIKDAGGEPLTAGLAELLWEAHQGTLAAMGVDVVVPVPHHWWDRAIRQQFPTETVGRVLARRLSIPMATHILAKRRRTPAQSSLPPSRRRRNLRNAFRIAGGARLDGLAMLLTDDILTTGTTADCAARTLKNAGAARVFVAVLARGIGHPR